MDLQLWRNATLLLNVNSQNILIDPMLGPKGFMDPFPWTSNNIRNPMVDLPFNRDELPLKLQTVDAVVVTHLHPDHWDYYARHMLRKDIPLFCRPGDEIKIMESGFSNVIPVEKNILWNGVKLSITNGHHGMGEAEKLMGLVCGFVFQYAETSLYIAGDTVWCSEVKDALNQFKPEYVVLNGAAATFNVGDPVTMTANDIMLACDYAPQARFFVVHMESVNPVTESRKTVRTAILQHDLSDRCFVPEDGGFLFKKTPL